MRPSQTIAAAGFGLGMIALAYVAPWLERTVLSIILWALFSASVWLRSAAAIAVDTPRQSIALSDAELPVYTVIIAMYREGSVVPKLVAALDAFDYPKAKLDIKLAIATQGKRVNLPGGLPIIVDGYTVGGIGVGSGTGAQDLDVARAAIRAFGNAKRFD